MVKLDFHDDLVWRVDFHIAIVLGEKLVHLATLFDVKIKGNPQVADGCKESSKIVHFSPESRPLFLLT